MQLRVPTIPGHKVCVRKPPCRRLQVEKNEGKKTQNDSNVKNFKVTWGLSFFPSALRLTIYFSSDVSITATLNGPTERDTPPPRSSIRL